MRLTIRVAGRPAPQGSKERGENGQLLESSRYLPAWRRAVVRGAYEAYAQHRIRPEALPLFPVGVPVLIDMLTFIVGPDQCRSEGTQLPIGTPDIDKLLRGTLDPLGGARKNTARLFADDSQVVAIGRMSKVRATAEQPAGAIIVVSQWRG